MARKNGNVRRSNDKGRLARRSRGERPIKERPSGGHAPITKMVMPDGQCTVFSTRPKARFATEEKAARALEAAQKARRRQGNPYVEKRYYACPDGGCGGFHLTSREQYDNSIRDFRHQQFLDKTKNARRAQIQEELRREQ